MDLITISNKIKEKISLIESIQTSIKQRGVDRAITISEYDKKLAINIMMLRSSDQPVQFIGKYIQPPIQTTIIEKIAKGLCWKEKLEMEKAEALYKSCVSNLNATMATLNALQSLHRHQQ
jgi:hypothetical protein